MVPKAKIRGGSFRAPAEMATIKALELVEASRVGTSHNNLIN